MCSQLEQTVRLHATNSRSRANGPGVRFVVWFQGCDLGCPGCYNPESHSPDTSATPTIGELIGEIEQHKSSIEGVSITGGEPLQQPEALLALTEVLRQRTDLSIVLFSGYRREEIEATPLGKRVLESIDVLIDGRFSHKQRLASGLLGSSNQQIHLLSERYTPDDIAATPVAEIQISPTGEVVFTGVDPVDVAPIRPRRSRHSPEPDASDPD